MHQLIRAWREAEKEVEKAQKRSEQALARAERIKAPKNLRPATAKDIKVGAVIWYPADPTNPYDIDHWKLVDEVLRPNDDWKAYTAHDGSRYGLYGAFVETR